MPVYSYATYYNTMAHFPSLPMLRPMQHFLKMDVKEQLSPLDDHRCSVRELSIQMGTLRVFGSDARLHV